MNAKVQKQFLLLKGKPLICYALEAFENSPVDRVILVAGQEDAEYCRKEIVERFGFLKVARVVPGGRERYHSVYQGLLAAGEMGCDLVLIHDGARPLLTEDVIERAVQGARDYGACVVAVPVKDTIKAAGPDGFVAATPDRSVLWQVQTPQAFSYEWIRGAYDRLFSKEEYQRGVTDDAMVLEAMTSHRVRLVEGSYFNIKVTTPEDMLVAEALLGGR